MIMNRDSIFKRCIWIGGGNELLNPVRKIEEFR